MAAIDCGLARQSGDFQQRIPHHRIGRLEHPPAPERKQRIAGEDDLVVLEPIDDVARGVSGRLDDLGDESADANAIAFAQARVERIDARRFLGRSGDAQLGKARPEAGNALDVIGMMMGDQNVGQRPTPRGGGGGGRVGVRRVDRDRRAR
jgi:hypothetical protein